jgi:hypothetical protein
MHGIHHLLLIHFSKWLTPNKDILYKLQWPSRSGFSTKPKQMFVEHSPDGLNNLAVLFHRAKCKWA